jgi:hypothetical protein
MTDQGQPELPPTEPKPLTLEERFERFGRETEHAANRLGREAEDAGKRLAANPVVRHASGACC